MGRSQNAKFGYASITLNDYRNSTSNWNDLIDRVEKEIRDKKNPMLTRAGRKYLDCLESCFYQMDEYFPHIAEESDVDSIQRIIEYSVTDEDSYNDIKKISNSKLRNDDVSLKNACRELLKSVEELDNYFVFFMMNLKRYEPKDDVEIS